MITYNTVRFGADLKILTSEGKVKKINLSPSTCRALLGNDIAYKFKSNRNIDAEVDLKDSAAGYIQLTGSGAYDKLTQEALNNYEVMVPVLDAIVGNTCILLDKSKDTKTKKAGEFKIISNGIEYRGLSNFWLKSYQLMSMVFGLSRQAVCLVASGYGPALLKKLNMEDIQKAINEDDFDLAMRNFKQVAKFVTNLTPENHNSYPLRKDNLEDFHYFIQKGVGTWFKGNSVKHWRNLKEGHGIGFESFLANRVNKARMKFLQKKA